MPTKGSPGSAGHDLYSNQRVILLPGSVMAISVGIGLILPPNHYAKIEDRSSLASSGDLLTAGGVIDRDYTGVVRVIIRNMSDRNTATICKGDRISQMIVHQIPETVAELKTEIPKTVRGSGGFGSTGK